MTQIVCPTCHGKGAITKPGTLTERQEEFYRLRYGDDGTVLRTYKQVGAVYGLTASRAREIITMAEVVLRHSIRPPGADTSPIEILDTDLEDLP